MSNKKSWNSKHDKFVLDNYGKLTSDQIAEELKVSRSTVDYHIKMLQKDLNIAYGVSSKSRSTLSSTICWDCVNAAGGSPCCWINGHIPVPGWEAEPTKITSTLDKKYIDSYRVIACPLFEFDAPKNIKNKK